MKTKNQIRDEVQAARKRHLQIHSKVQGVKKTLNQFGSIAKLCSYLIYVGWDFRTEEDDNETGEFHEQKLMGFKTKHQVNLLLCLESFPENPTNLDLLSCDIYGDNILDKAETAIEFCDVLIESFKDELQIEYWNQFDNELNMYYGKEEKVQHLEQKMQFYRQDMDF